MKKYLINILLFFLSIFFVFIILEASLRILGEQSWQKLKNSNKEPVTYENDKLLGWKPKKGIHTFRPWSTNGKQTNLTVLENGSRLTSNLNFTGKKEILFIGGSITQGWAVDDKETFPWLLQEKLKEFKVNNFGVGGYGGFQSMLLLEKIFEKKKNVKYVVYGFIPHHEVRNIATGSWMHLLARFSNRGIAELPYASLDKNNKLIKNKPIKYINLPWREKSALIAKVEKKIMKIRSFKRSFSTTKISHEIILEMKKISESNDSVFMLVFLDDTPPDVLYKYITFLKKNDVNYLNCPIPRLKEFVVENEGHPNGKGHKIVAECLYTNLNN